MIVDQVKKNLRSNEQVKTYLKSRGKWLEIIAKLQECDCVTHKESSTSAAELVAGLITYLSGPILEEVCRSLLFFIRSVL